MWLVRNLQPMASYAADAELRGDSGLGLWNLPLTSIHLSNYLVEIIRIAVIIVDQQRPELVRRP